MAAPLPSRATDEAVPSAAAYTPCGVAGRGTSSHDFGTFEESLWGEILPSPLVGAKAEDVPPSRGRGRAGRRNRRSCGCGSGRRGLWGSSPGRPCGGANAGWWQWRWRRQARWAPSDPIPSQCASPKNKTYQTTDRHESMDAGGPTALKTGHKPPPMHLGWTTSWQWPVLPLRPPGALDWSDSTALSFAFLGRAQDPHTPRQTDGGTHTSRPWRRRCSPCSGGRPVPPRGGRRQGPRILGPLPPPPLLPCPPP